MSLSSLTRDQWISVVKNALIAGLAAFAVALQTDSSKTGLTAASVAAITAVAKMIEKGFQQG